MGRGVSGTPAAWVGSRRGPLIGPITIDGTIGYNAQTLELDFNVTVNGTSVTGPGMFLPAGKCGPGVAFSPGFQVDGEDVVGTLELCSIRGIALPVGELVVTLSNPPIIVELTFDGTPAVGVVVRHLTGELLFTCSVNILSMPIAAICE